MTEPSWAEGYVVDVGYTHGYYRLLSPAALRFAALLGGLQPPDARRPFTYYELGCGNGLSCVLHAACHPADRFIGVDFNPLHVRNARARAEEAAIANVEFLEKSFAELLEADLPDADYITLHGVYSWVSPENRAHIVEFVRRRLKPGGFVYISYNCLPGLAQVAPLQRLLQARTAAGHGALHERLRGTLKFIRALEEAGAEYFRANPLAAQRAKQIAAQDPSYVAHEYLNAHWTPLYHADVARELSSAKLAYAASAQVADNFEQFVLRPEIAALIHGADDPVLGETLKDFARNRVFRRDVFARGAPKADARELDGMLGATRFALARPRALCTPKASTPVGEVTLQEDRYAPVLDALARAPMTFDELAGAQADRAQLRQTLFALAALQYVTAALPARGEAERRAATDRYNAALLRRAARTAAPTVLASPVLGEGVAAGQVDLLLLGGPREPAGAVQHACNALAESGQPLVENGVPVHDAKRVRALVERRAQAFFAELLPFYRLVGVAG